VKRLLTIIAALLALAGCGSQSSSDIATVNISRITSNWPKFINYRNQLAADQDALAHSSAPTSEKQKTFQQLEEQSYTMQTEIANDIRQAAEQIAEQRHFKLVVTREFVGYGGVDITPDVEKLLKIDEKAPSDS
jgi:Skp family chaperone for outer membrane proteins